MIKNTKVTVIDSTKEIKGKIVFSKVISASGDCLCASMSPHSYDNIELIVMNYNGSGYDLMFAFDNDKISQGTLYLGHFNDGVV